MMIVVDLINVLRDIHGGVLEVELRTSTTSHEGRMRKRRKSNDGI